MRNVHFSFIATLLAVYARTAWALNPKGGSELFPAASERVCDHQVSLFMQGTIFGALLLLSLGALSLIVAKRYWQSFWFASSFFVASVFCFLGSGPSQWVWTGWLGRFHQGIMIALPIVALALAVGFFLSFSPRHWARKLVLFSLILFAAGTAMISLLYFGILTQSDRFNLGGQLALVLSGVLMWTATLMKLRHALVNHEKAKEHVIQLDQALLELDSRVLRANTKEQVFQELKTVLEKSIHLHCTVLDSTESESHAVGNAEARGENTAAIPIDAENRCVGWILVDQKRYERMSGLHKEFIVSAAMSATLRIEHFVNSGGSPSAQETGK